MCSAIDVADYILEEKGRMSTFQLQKLIYYCQAWGLAVNGAGMFPEPVKAWANGPVVYDVFQRHAGRYTVVASDMGGDRTRIPDEALPVLDAVIASYGGLTGDEIRDLTHSEAPWADAYNGQSGLAAATISDDAMRDYYAGLRDGDERTRRAHHVPHFVVEPVIRLDEEDFDWLTSQL